jgi:hypothetical protein
VKHSALSLAAGARSVLATSKGRRIAAAAGIILVALIVWAIWQQHSAKRDDSLFAGYQKLYSRYHLANNSNPPKANNLDELTGIQSQLAGLKAQTANINNQLANNELQDGEPTTVAAFASLVQQRIDALSGLETIASSTIKSLPATALPNTHYEISNGAAYIFSQSQKPTLSIVDISTHSIKTSAADFSHLGVIQATTLSATGEGIFILTAQPSLWLYSFDSDSLKTETPAFGSWPTGTAIGSYLTNLYILSDDNIYKFVKAGTGYGPKSTYSSLKSTPASGATSLAVDGSVYTANTQTLTEFVASAVKQSLPISPISSPLSHLRSASNGTLLTAIDQKQNRIIIFRNQKGAWSLSRQLTAPDLRDIQDASYDSASKQIIVLTKSGLFGLAYNP